MAVGGQRAAVTHNRLKEETSPAEILECDSVAKFFSTDRTRPNLFRQNENDYRA